MLIKEQKVMLVDGTIKKIKVKCYVPGEEQEIVEAVQEALAKKSSKIEEPIMVLSPQDEEVVPDETDLD